MSFSSFIKELNGNRVEGELIKTFVFSLIAGIVAIALFYFLDAPIVQNYLLYLILGIITYSLLGLTLLQVNAYKKFGCMSGMMIGMTCGMIAGFLPGYYLGATNGMFFGGMFGMIVGIVFGIWNGKCCGIMGVMEGVMAGFMGGWMGAMTSVMLLNDHLLFATIAISIVGWALMLMLNYMIYFESKDREAENKEPMYAVLAFVFIATIVTELAIFYLPRSFLFG
ncbi:MAG: hypothetical protein AABX11_03135 [Nanoarchaeota archaeon]